MAKPDIVIPVNARLKTLFAAEHALEELLLEVQRLIDDAQAASDVAAAYVRIESANRQLDKLFSQIATLATKMATETVPERFELGRTTSTTVLGYRATISEQIRASIRKDMRDEAFAWLREHGHGDLIKIEPTVHPQTLQAWARTMIEDGEDLPDKLLSIHQFTNTSLTKAK